MANSNFFWSESMHSLAASGQYARSCQIPAVLSIAVAGAGVSAPSMATANDELVKGLIGAAVIICLAGACKPKKTTSRKSTKSAGSGKSGSVDSGSPDKSERMLIQQALARLGHYTGTIDGDFGPGTRNAIRAWQTALGAPVTGVLSATEVNALMAASPKYAVYSPTDPMLFEADLAVDLTEAEIKTLQALLNDLGFDAGPVDGDMGGKTRAAIAAYKVEKLLPGDPIPTKRLLAHVEGAASAGPIVVAAGKGAGIAGVAEAAGEAVPYAAADGFQKPVGVGSLAAVAATVEVPAAPVVAPAHLKSFELAGLRIGMTDADIQEVAAEYLESEVIVQTAAAADFNGDALFSLGQMLTQVSWPAAPAEQIVALYDETLPELGALAIFRSVLLDPSVTQEVFDTTLLASMIETYGREGMVEGKLVWIGESSAREAARLSTAALASCGSLMLQSIDSSSAAPDVSWTSGVGTKLDTASLDTVTAKCGDVLTVRFQPGLLSFGFWNSDLIVERRAAMLGGAAAAVVPALKF